MVAKKEAKDGENWTAIVRQFQFPNSRGQVISLLVAGCDGPKTPQFSRFSSFWGHKNGKKLIHFIRISFVCIYPIWVPHFPVVNVSRYAFFAVHSTTHFKLLVSFRVNFLFHRMNLVFFVSFFFRSALTLLVPYFLTSFSSIELFLMIFLRAWWVLFISFIIAYLYSFKLVGFSP